MVHIEEIKDDDDTQTNVSTSTTSTAPSPAREVSFDWVASFLRRPKFSGLRIRQGIQDGKRVDFFKGKDLVDSLLKPTFRTLAIAQKSAVLESRQQAIDFAQLIMTRGYFNRAHRKTSTSLESHPHQVFLEDGYFVWTFELSAWRTTVLGFALLVFVLLCCFYPVWPYKLRLGVSYLAWVCIGIIIAFVGLSVFRMILYGVTSFIFPPGLWLFPNLFEDVGFVASFKPLFGWHDPKKQTASSDQTKAD